LIYIYKQLKLYFKINSKPKDVKRKSKNDENSLVLNRILNKVDMKKIESKEKSIKTVGRLKLINVPPIFKNIYKNRRKDMSNMVGYKENISSYDYFNRLSIPKRRVNKENDIDRCLVNVNQSLEYLRRVQVYNNNEVLNMISDYKSKSLFIDPALCILGINKD
jgi:hypothetical protein